jgi:hypothetical protein
MPISPPARTNILRIASVAAAVLLLGVAADAADVADTAEARRSTDCVRRLVVSHVPGRLDKVWVVGCIPIGTPITGRDLPSR